MAAELAKAAGLHDIDVALVERWVIDVLLPQQRREVTTVREEAGSVLAEFLNDNIGNMIAVARHKLPIVPDSQEDYVRRDLAPGHSLRARFEESSGNTYILRSAFETWCRRRHKDYQAALDEMERQGPLLKRHCRTRLGRGLPQFGSTGGPLSTCIVVNATRHESPDGDSGRVPVRQGAEVTG
ncbi:hypothetical protein [Paraburkholderia eburnea]|uniref:hypothetical protein n=1 Tax=Paraburkholderia eburnea TaxID=1189126 RepID=UPI0011B0A67C|nr:hypothetical protein [Paraburkholderia eburnea]